jgi:hypothetical protein
LGKRCPHIQNMGRLFGQRGGGISLHVVATSSGRGGKPWLWHLPSQGAWMLLCGAKLRKLPFLRENQRSCGTPCRGKS